MHAGLKGQPDQVSPKTAKYILFPKTTNYSFFVIITLLVSYVILIFPILDGPGRATEDHKFPSSSSSIVTLYVREAQAQTYTSTSSYGGCFALLLSSKNKAEILRRKVAYVSASRFTCRSLCSKRQAKSLVPVLIKKEYFVRLGLSKSHCIKIGICLHWNF
jgi:hypothetical protein